MANTNIMRPMLSHFIFYLALVGLIYMGLSRRFKYADKKQLWTAAVGFFGVVVFLIDDYGSLLFNLSPSQGVIFYRLCQAADALLALAIIILLIWEFTRKSSLAGNGPSGIF